MTARVLLNVRLWAVIDRPYSPLFDGTTVKE